MQTLSTQFITQFFQRLGEKTPKFFNILTLIFSSAGVLLLGLTALESQLTDLHKPIPDWFTYVNFVLKGFLSLSGIITAQAAIKTPSTPLLASELPKPKLEDLAKIIADQQTKIERLEANAPGVTAPEP